MPSGIIMAIGLGAALAGAGRPAPAGEFRVPLMKAAPKIDGRVDPDEWAVSAGFEGFGRDGGQLGQRRIKARVGATETHIFIAVRSQLPDKGSLAASVMKDSLKAVFDDAVEVFVNPTPDDAGQVEYQFLVNSLGRGGYNIHTLGGAKEDAAWRGGWEQAHGSHDGYWHFECAIPVAGMPMAGKGRKTTDGAWKINLTRDWKGPWQWSSLAAAPGGYAWTGLRFTFAKDAPAVQYEADSDPFLADFTGTLTVRNPTGRRMDLQAAATLTRNRMPAVRAAEKLALAPGEMKKLVLTCPPDEATTRFELHVLVASADGKAVFYDRKVSWPRGKPYRYVAGEKARPAPVSFRFAYYPYLNRMRVLADINGLPEGAKLTKLTAEVRERLEKQVVHRAAFDTGRFREGRQEIAFELPPLDGLYEIALIPEGTNVPGKETVRTFERKVFPWEHTPVGRSTKVYPPFTPIEVDAKAGTLKTVLREHKLNGLGLWDQVAATSAHTGITKPILAAPMRYAANVDGEPVEVQAGPLRIVSARPHEVVTQGEFSVGPVRCTSKSTWDYDGTAKVDLDVGGTGGRELRELTLEIPFAARAATLIHANSDRIRAPVAQRIAEQQGVVWDASKVACDEMPRNFCPYVYVGDAVRGVCWFAENNLGWSWDPNTPNVTLVRRGDTVTLRIHLVNKPLVSDGPRRITFGLLAAPVKPRLSPGGKHWWRYRYYRDNYTLLGTDINWLARGSCGSVYPAGKDMYLWEMIARGNREKLAREDIQKVIDHSLRYFKDYPDRVPSWEAHVRHNLTSRYGTKMVFYYNRASCQLFEEFETFKDEWCLTDLRSVPRGRGVGEIKIAPSPSYIDHALYWYARSFEVGANRGVYWDNFFIAPSYNTEMTDAYARRKEGDVVPAAGIWALRELAKRTFILMSERGMPPVTFPHMTSFNP
ncbi:MAG: glycoside hydrolase domain-containing protein, partial [Phycisphaerae bacterium]